MGIFRRGHYREGDHFHFSQQILILSREGLARRGSGPAAQPKNVIQRRRRGATNLRDKTAYACNRLVLLLGSHSPWLSRNQSHVES
jgi:hypothetical protein